MKPLSSSAASRCSKRSEKPLTRLQAVAGCAPWASITLRRAKARPAPAEESAGAVHPLPLGEGLEFLHSCCSYRFRRGKHGSAGFQPAFRPISAGWKPALPGNVETPNPLPLGEGWFWTSGAHVQQKMWDGLSPKGEASGLRVHPVISRGRERERCQRHSFTPMRFRRYLARNFPV
jgi:hypothetical protein